MRRASVYSPAMQPHARPALPQRIVALLRAKEFLVFYAIGLAALDLCVPLATGWLRDHRSLPDLAQTQNSAIGDAVAGHGPAVIALTAVYLLLSAWFSAGYLRSLLGKLHWGPRDGLQYRRMLAFVTLLALLDWGLSAGAAAAGDNLTALQALLVLQVAVNVPLLYANYAIVASNVGLVRAIARSLRTFAANAVVSLLVLLALFEVVLVLGVIAPPTADTASGVLPALLIHTLAWGSVSFLADVVLLSVYVDTVERGTLPPG